MSKMGLIFTGSQSLRIRAVLTESPLKTERPWDIKSQSLQACPELATQGQGHTHRVRDDSFGEAARYESQSLQIRAILTAGANDENFALAQEARFQSLRIRAILTEGRLGALGPKGLRRQYNRPPAGQPCEGLQTTKHLKLHQGRTLFLLRLQKRRHTTVVQVRTPRRLFLIVYMPEMNELCV